MQPAYNDINIPANNVIWYSYSEFEATRMYDDFYNSSIEANVGVNCDSIALFARYLESTNARRPKCMRKDEDAMTLRLLYAMTKVTSVK